MQQGAEVEVLAKVNIVRSLSLKVRNLDLCTSH